MRVCHITINEIDLERRIFNQIKTAQKCGYKVLVIAHGKSGQNSLERKNGFVLWKIITKYYKSGMAKYMVFNFKLFFRLLFTPINIIHCHDLWPLPAAALAALLKNSALIYDAHEYYAGLKIFENRLFRKYLWMSLEWLAIPVTDVLITVSRPLGELYNKRYPQLKKVNIIRNLPQYETPQIIENLKIRKNKHEKIVIFHGHFKPGRGLENLVKAAVGLNDIRFLLVGGGELEPELKQMVNQLNLSDVVQFIEYIDKEMLISHSAQADIGVVLFQPTSLNYSYALPNKFFEYIMAGLPILASNIETLAFYVEKYDIGRTVDPANPELIAETIEEMLQNEKQMIRWSENCKQAALELNWEKEEHKLMQIYGDCIL